MDVGSRLWLLTYIHAHTPTCISDDTVSVVISACFLCLLARSHSHQLFPLYPAQEDCSEVLGRLRELEPRIEMQLSHLRGDIKGALATAAASSRAEMEAEAGQRVKEAEKRLSLRLQGGWVGMEALKCR